MYLFMRRFMFPVSKKSDCLIIGAGWAGLSAALSLTRAGKSVVLLEAAPKAGGRARAVTFNSITIDNGQHLFLGAYQKFRQVLQWLQVEEKNIFHPSAF